MSEETYSFLCPSCSAHLSVPVSAAGVSGPCPYCASTITSPMPHEVPLEDMMAIEEAMAEESAAQQPPPPPADPGYAIPPPAAPGQEWNTPAEGAPTAERVAPVGVETMEAEATQPERRSRRKKRGERVPKGKKKRNRQNDTSSQRREEATPRPASQAAATVVDTAAEGGGLSLFAKVCVGVAGVALVALGAVYGLPAIMGDGGDTIPSNEGAGSELLNDAKPPMQAGGLMTPSPDPSTPAIEPTLETAKSEPTIPTVPVAGASNPPDSGALPEPPSRAPDAFTDTSLPASMTTYTPAPDSILVKPRQALDNFLAAPNWKERLKYVTGGKALSSEMRSYYTQYPDGVLDPVSVNWTLNDKDPDGKTEIFVFTVSFDIEENDGLVYLDFPTVVEGSNGNYTVNWHSFVEFYDRHLHQFVTKRAFNKPQKFHVIAVRSHYFGSDSELKAKVESGEFVCVTANSPNPDDGTQAFLSTQHKSGKEMAAGLLWEKAAGGQFDTPLVELCWKKTKAGTPYVEITKVLGDKWRDTPK